MSFTSSTYGNFITDANPTQQRLFKQYNGSRSDFDIIIIGSGMGGGLLADDLADRIRDRKRILVLEAGSFLLPTHVYNLCRFPNDAVAAHFECKNFTQSDNEWGRYFIGRYPQMNLGGRSIFWSGLIPKIQDWELEFFPPSVRHDLKNNLLEDAGKMMNQSATMGSMAQKVAAKLRQSSLDADFVIQETPRALHQPYMSADGAPKKEFFAEPTGVFNTAELLINQLGLVPDSPESDDHKQGLHLLLNHFVEDIQRAPGDRFVLVTSNTLTNEIRHFNAGTVVIAAGSIESPKLLRRSSSLYHSLPGQVKALVGLGLTDHPTTNAIETLVTHMGDIEIKKDEHAKIIFYSKGRRQNGEIVYPFNVEMNINHEYWHLRENDPDAPQRPIGNDGESTLGIKFSFGNCLDDSNQILEPPPFAYIPEIKFHNQKYMDHLRDSRFPALAGWHKSYEEIFAVLNEITHQIFSQFQRNGNKARPLNEGWMGTNGKGFGYGTVHHAVGSLRMPYRPNNTAPFQQSSVVDEDLRMIGTRNLYVCDMSVMPISTAANPVRTLAALALRLSKHLG